MAALDIIIPVYNEGLNIIRAVEALRREVKSPFRILICYDFDEDNTLTALREYDTSGLDILLGRNEAIFLSCCCSRPIRFGLIRAAIPMRHGGHFMNQLAC